MCCAEYTLTIVNIFYHIIQSEYYTKELIQTTNESCYPMSS